MGFLRAAQVGLVTPLRDGMNLVAKEFVAAQDPKDPGVLILSPMAGAARELTGALKVNPYDKRAMAVALQDALHMPLEERRRRHQQMMEALHDKDIHHWYGQFCSDLDRVSTTRVREVQISIAADAHETPAQGWLRRKFGRLFNSRVSS
jgi:trehalose 6-phosphate synthase